MVFVKVNEKNEVVHIRFNFTYDLEDVNISEGMVFDDLPVQEEIEGKLPQLLYDETNKKLYYEYKSIPPTEAEMTKQRLDELEAALVELASLLGGGQ